MGKLNKRSGLSVLVWFVVFAVGMKDSIRAAAVICNDPPTLDCINPLFENILQAVLALAGFACFLLLIAGGVKYITAGGDAKAMASAQQTLTAAIGGLIVTIVVYFVLKTILGIFGLNLSFEVPSPSLITY